jgi:hypothetical protein
MIAAQQRHWSLNPAESLDDAWMLLEKHFQRQEVSSQTLKITVYDSFGWDIWHSGQLLYSQNKELVLQRRARQQRMLLKTALQYQATV